MRRAISLTCGRCSSISRSRLSCGDSSIWYACAADMAPLCRRLADRLRAGRGLAEHEVGHAARIGWFDIVRDLLARGQERDRRPGPPRLVHQAAERGRLVELREQQMRERVGREALG